MSFQSKLVYFARTAATSLVRSPFVHAVAVLTLTLSLSTYGLARVLRQQLEALTQTLSSEVELTVYLAEGASDDEVARLEAALTERTGGSALRVSPAQALGRLLAQLGPAGAALESLEKNPLPWSLELTVPPGARTPADLKALAERARALPLVTGVDYGEEALERLEAVARGLRVGSLFLFLVVFVTAAIVVSATLQLAIYARREEIEIQKLVGGTDAFVRAPFIIEGVLQGLVSAGLACGVLAACAWLWGPLVAEALAFLKTAPPPREFLMRVAAELVALGVALGLFGSMVAVRRFLRV